MYEIYMIRCIKNNRKYVGVTTRGWQTRTREHLSGNGGIKLLTKDVKLYGSENFESKLLIHGITTKQQAGISEMLCIRLYQAHKYKGGYNTTLGGEFVENYKHLPEHGKLISAKLKNVPKSVEHRKHLSESRKGKFTKHKNGFYHKHHTKEVKQYLSKIRSKKLLMLDKDDNIVMQFDSLLQASSYLLDNGITSNKNCNSRISKCCLNKSDAKTAYGYKWKYVE